MNTTGISAGPISIMLSILLRAYSLKKMHFACLILQHLIQPVAMARIFR